MKDLLIVLAKLACVILVACFNPLAALNIVHADMGDDDDECF